LAFERLGSVFRSLPWERCTDEELGNGCGGMDVEGMDVEGWMWM